MLNSYMLTFLQLKDYSNKVKGVKSDCDWSIRLNSVFRAAKKWHSYVKNRKKLRNILQTRNKEHLMFNRL
jgi:hypothetical protein